MTFPNTIKDSHSKEMQTYADTMAVSLQPILENNPHASSDISAIFSKVKETAPFVYYLIDSSEVIVTNAQNSEITTNDKALSKNALPLRKNQSLNTILRANLANYFYTESTITTSKGTYTLITAEPYDAIKHQIIPAQVFGFGILLVGVFIASLISYWSYNAAFNSVRRVERSLYSFLSNSSHEMKTPVASIKLLSESILIAEKQNKSDKVVEFTNKIIGSSNHLDKLVRDMLTITRTNAPFTTSIALTQQEEKQNQTQVSKAIDKAVAAYRDPAEEKNLELKTALDPRTNQCFIRLSESDLLSILYNLLSNAIAYTDEGYILVATEVLSKEIKISISDTGCGIPKQEINRIFERFYRVEKTRSKYPQGTGLGLPLVSGFVAKAQGKIQIESELDKGSTFDITFPLHNQ